MRVNLLAIRPVTTAVAANPYAPSDIQAGYALPKWAGRTNLPVALYRHATVAALGRIFVLGGNNGTAAVATVYSAAVNSDGSLGSWQTLNALPQPLQNETAVFANGRIYVLGGDNVSTVSAAVYSAVVNSNGTVGSWAAATALPSPITQHAGVFVNGRLIVVGGQAGNGTPLTSVLTTVVHVDGTLDPTWTTNPNSLLSGRRNHGAVVSGRYLVVGGGLDASGNPSSAVFEATINADGSIGSFSQQALSLPIAVDSFGFVAWRGNLALLGGSPGIQAPVTSVYFAQIDPATGSVGHADCSASQCWRQSYYSLPVGLQSLGAVVANGALVTTGGENASISPVANVSELAVNVATGTTNAGVPATVAVVFGTDLANAESDLSVYRNQYGLPPCTTSIGCFVKVMAQSCQTSCPANPAQESEYSLDMSMVSSACPNCQILLMEADSALSVADLASAANLAAVYGNTDPNFAPVAISNSYGTQETSGIETTYDSDYSHPGIAVTAAAGNGGYCATNCSGSAGSLYPAASRYVIAAGGTYLTQSHGAWTEQVWNNQNSSDAGATASACSHYAQKPAWQSDAGCPNRTIADVAVVADGPGGISIYNSQAYNGQPVGFQHVFGTSAASPLIAGMIAVAGSGWNSASFLYAHKSSLADLTSGSNGSCGSKNSSTYYLCNAITGYDGPSGVGTPLNHGVAAFGPTAIGLTWAQANPPNPPSVRGGAGMAYDALTNTVVLFGGRSYGNINGGVTNDTWSWDGRSWTLLHPAHAPTPRAGFGMDYDNLNGKIVLFGGVDASAAILNDTWTYDGTDWTLQNPPAPLPPARWDTAMAYDAASNTSVLFGGAASGDTWTWNGSTWAAATQVTPPPPSSRRQVAMTYDAASQTVIMFGGWDNNANVFLNETWSFNGSIWTQLHPAASPSLRSKATMAYNGSTGVGVLFGGEYCGGVWPNCGPLTYYADTWTWDGTNWKQPSVSASPLARVYHDMAYDPNSTTVLLFGGSPDDNAQLNDTWFW